MLADAIPLPAGADAQEKAQKLPRLREDLGIFPSARAANGERSWVLHDPVRNRYYQIGEAEFLMLSLWDKSEDVDQLVQAMSMQGMPVEAESVGAFAEFLGRGDMILLPAGSSERFTAMHKMRQRSLWEEILHGYLFFRVPLIRPDRLLDKVYPRLRSLISFRFAMVTAIVGFVSLLLVLRQWDIFRATFLGFLSLEGAASFAISLALVKILHEAGHALACKHFGLRVPSVGVAFIVMWPVMYTDASEAWRLTSRRARLAIACAGMLVEMTIACYSTLLWVLLPDGILRSVMFTLATTTWVMSLAVNLNPLMRFDGYYIFSDLFNIPNLQERGFALARNRMRHVLFGVDLISDPCLPPREGRIAMAWAYATWVYRFFLFLGIAFLVYHFFFKALGIFLFLVEVWWFILGPIWREVKNWREHLSDMSQLRQRLWLAAGVILLLLLLFPWQTSFRAPALMRAEQLLRLYPAEPARLAAVQVQNGQRVEKGDVLLTLESPELESQLAAASTAVSRARFELNRVMANARTASDRLVAEEALGRAEASLANLRVRQQTLQLRAPFAGILSDIPPEAREGLWTGGRQLLGVLIGAGGQVVDAYVTEDRLRFVRLGEEAAFYPEDITVAVQKGRVVEIDAVDTAVLSEPYLAEPLGGGIPVRMTARGGVPEQAVYRVRIRLEPVASPGPGRILRGYARLEGDSRSLLQRGLGFVVGVVLRESGF